MLASLVLSGGVAFAESISQPSARPIAAPVDRSGQLVPFTVTAAGFPAGTQVFVEQCDGVSPAAPQWSPTEHCDLGSSPAAATADTQGRVTFLAGDSSHAFAAFVGESPQSLFNCGARTAPQLHNGLPSFTNCQLRVSTNNAAVTADQVFATIVLTPGAKNPPRAPSSVVTTTLPRGKPSPVGPARSTTTTTPHATTGTPPGSSNIRAHAALATPAARASGWFALSDPGVALAYGVLAIGLAIAGVSLLRGRARRAPRVSR